MKEGCIVIIVPSAKNNSNNENNLKKISRIWSKEWYLKTTKYTNHNLLDESIESRLCKCSLNGPYNIY